MTASSSTVVAVAALAGAVYVFARAYIWLTQDPKEPPLIVGTIPYLSHLIGLSTKKAQYYHDLWKTNGLPPIYTLPMIGPRLYVMNSRHWIRRIDNHIDTLAFIPLEYRTAETLMALSQDGLDKIGGSNMYHDSGYFIAFPRAVASATTPGKALDDLCRTAGNAFAKRLDKMAKNSTATNVELFEWSYEEIFNATNESTYGPSNPFRHHEAFKAWYDFEPGILPLLVGALPPFFLRHTIRAREVLAKHFIKYFAEDGDTSASAFLLSRQKHNVKFDLNKDDCARVEISQTVASIGNAAPSAFWFIWQIWSTPALLDACRREVMAIVTVTKEGTRVIDLAQVKEKCPTLAASWDETVRFHGHSISARVVKEDTLVDDQYLFKKDGIIILPNNVTHVDPAIWGPTADQFDHERFLKTTKNGTLKRVANSNYRGFGSGHVLCPGRYFMAAEILSFLALLLARFDVRPVGGKWFHPGKDYAMTSAFSTPKKKFHVELIPRDAYAWDVQYSNPATVGDEQEVSAE